MANRDEFGNKITCSWKTYHYLFILAVAKNYNMNKMKCVKGLLLLVGVSFLMSSCFVLGGKGGKPTAQNPGQVSTATGLKYNEADGGGFAVKPYDSQPDAPNMVFIEGGRAVMGSFEEDVM